MACLPHLGSEPHGLDYIDLVPLFISSAENRDEHLVETRSLSVPQWQFVMPNRADAGHFGEEPAQASAVSAGQDQGQRQQQAQELIGPGGWSEEA